MVFRALKSLQYQLGDYYKKVAKMNELLSYKNSCTGA